MAKARSSATHQEIERIASSPEMAVWAVLQYAQKANSIRRNAQHKTSVFGFGIEEPEEPEEYEEEFDSDKEYRRSVMVDLMGKNTLVMDWNDVIWRVVNYDNSTHVVTLQNETKDRTQDIHIELLFNLVKDGHMEIVRKAVLPDPTSPSDISDWPDYMPSTEVDVGEAEGRVRDILHHLRERGGTSHSEEVLEWRRLRATQMGFAPALADLIAHTNVELASLERLIERGATPFQALRILFGTDELGRDDPRLIDQTISKRRRY
ncbi:MAG: hypothetical protein QXU32_01505 [Nitrososphaerales archaeon]